MSNDDAVNKRAETVSLWVTTGIFVCGAAIALSLTGLILSWLWAGIRLAWML